MEAPKFFNLDIEPTNRCNASCYFCPRDQTPHQGLMSMEVFEQTLVRTIEFRSVVAEIFGAETTMKVNFCGLGEPLLNKHTPAFVRRVREAGFECSISSNAALLDEDRGEALLEAGLQGIEINVGEEGEAYEEVYRLPFERTYDNVVRFAEMAGDDCRVSVVLVNHRRDADHQSKMKEFWRERGIKHFHPFEIMNRGGALFVDHMQFEAYPELAEARAIFEQRGVVPVCPVPFVYLFVGYDGQYYLCCSDWRKEAPLGSVFDESFLSITQEKLDEVLTREPVCKSCNLDPFNLLTEQLRAVKAGESDESETSRMVDRLISGDEQARHVVQRLEPLGIGRLSATNSSAEKKRIPLRVV